MKRLLAFFVFALIFSCSSDDAQPQQNIDPTLLQKIVFYPGTANETHWNFYPDGLLKEIAKPDGTVLQDFVYQNNNLVSTTQYAGSGNLVTTFTYDNNNFLTSINGYPVSYTYDGTGGKYTFDYVVPVCDECAYDNPHKTEIQLNSDLLPVSRKVFFNYYPTGEEFYYLPYDAGYENGNLAFYRINNADLEYHSQFDNHPNPLKAALLPVTRAFAVSNGNSIYGDSNWNNADYTSTNNVTSFSYSSEDPESTGVSYDYNANNLPIIQTSQAYFQGQMDGTSHVTAYYYYQGDVVP